MLRNKVTEFFVESVKGFLVKLIAGLTAYCFFPKKPSLNITHIETRKLALIAISIFTSHVKW